jgi:glyoxylase-like metal-dependent hydrolase (beta-lactamase superfamily II)
MPSQPMGTGGVREFRLGKNRRMFKITTFCPDLIGPGPTHLYLIEDDALILVDTGMPTDSAKDMFYYWRNQGIPEDVEALADDHSEQELMSALKLTGHDIRDIDYIVLTHGHPDHYLLGRKLIEMSGAKVAVHVSDSDQVANPWGMIKFWVERRAALMAMGMPMPGQGGGSTKASVSPEKTDTSLHIDIPIAFDGRLHLEDFEKDEICVRHFAGHSPGGIALLLYDDSGKEAIMLCGDTLLNPITPHPDDLLEYLRALRAMKKLEEVKLTLPAHGREIADLAQRLEFLEDHHEDRLKVTYETCKEPHSVWQLATMKGYFDVFVDPAKFNPLAGQEAFVHVELLHMAGGLRRTHIDGFTHYFESTGEKFEDVYARVQELIKDENTTALSRRH